MAAERKEKMGAHDAIVIEQHNATGMEWVVSLDGPNPEPDGRWFACATKIDATRAADIINELPAE